MPNAKIYIMYRGIVWAVVFLPLSILTFCVCTLLYFISLLGMYLFLTDVNMCDSVL